MSSATDTRESTAPRPCTRYSYKSFSAAPAIPARFRIIYRPCLKPNSDLTTRPDIRRRPSSRRHGHTGRPTTRGPHTAQPSSPTDPTTYAVRAKIAQRASLGVGILDSTRSSTALELVFSSTNRPRNAPRRTYGKNAFFPHAPNPLTKAAGLTSCQN